MLRKNSWFGILSTAFCELRIDTSISLWTTIFGALFVLASKFNWWIMCIEIFWISRIPYWLLLTEFLIYITCFIMYSIIATLSPSCGCFPMLFHDLIFLPILSMMNMMIFWVLTIAFANGQKNYCHCPNFIALQLKNL